MVLAYHLILSAYGFWLPNDPRGSWSTFVRAWELHYYGPATKVSTHRSVAHVRHDRERRAHAKLALKYPPVTFDGLQARAIARGFATAADEREYVVYACAIMPDHVHMVVARHAGGMEIEDIADHFKSRASRRMNEEMLHPLGPFRQVGKSPPCPWAEKEWKCYLDSSTDIQRAVGYVDNNPIKDGLKKQKWEFVLPYRA